MVGTGFIVVSLYLALVLCTAVTPTPVTNPDEKSEDILVEIISVPVSSENAGKVSAADIFRHITEFENAQVNSSHSQEDEPVSQTDSFSVLPVDDATSQPTSPKSSSFRVSSGPVDTPSKSASVTSQSSDTSVKVAKSGSEIDVTTVLIIGVTAAGLLVVLTVVVVVAVVCRKKGKKDFSLNKDLHTWDPQILRPAKKDIDAFIFGSPIPTVEEMIKQ